MDKSPKHAPGKAQRLTHPSATKLTAAAIAALAAVLAVTHFLPQDDTAPGQVLRPTTEQYPNAAASTVVPAASAARATGVAGAESDVRRHPAPLQQRASEPGITLAELCTIAGDTLQCESTATAHSSFVTGGNAAAGDPPAIAGRVLAPDGAAVADATVVATPTLVRVGSEDDAAVRFQTVTDLNGAYELHGLPDAEYVVRASKGGPYGPARLSVRSGVTAADLVLSEEQHFIVEGRVTTHLGEPLEGVTVSPFLLGVASVITDDAGYYRLPIELRPNSTALALRFQRAGFRDLFRPVDARTLRQSGSETVVAKMQPIEYLTSVTGRVTGDDGEALAGRTVVLRALADRRAHRTVTDEDGYFLFETVEAPAEYNLSVVGAPGHKDYRQRISVSSDEYEFNVAAERFEFGNVTGRLVNTEGNPVPGFRLLLRNAASNRANIELETDANGYFDIPGVPAGKLVVATQSDPSILARGIELEPGGRLELPLVIDWGNHEIRGLVLDHNGNPLPASRVVLNWTYEEDGIVTRATRRAAADAQGQFQFGNLGPGPHSLTVSAQGYRPVALQHDIEREGYNLTVRLN